MRKKPSKSVIHLIIVATVVVGLVAVFAGYQTVFASRIYPNVYIGSVAVGGLTKEAATQKLQGVIDGLQSESISVDGAEKVRLTAADLQLTYDVPASITSAYAVGREGTMAPRLWQRLRALFVRTKHTPTWNYDETTVQTVLTTKLFTPATDRVQEVTITASSDGTVTAKPGKAGMVLDEDLVVRDVRQRFASLNLAPLAYERFEFLPRFTVDDAADAIAQAQAMLAAPLTLTYPDGTITLTVDQLAPWITATTVVLANKQLVLAAAVDTDAIAQAVKTRAFDDINRDPSDAKVRFTDGRVEVFQPSQQGLTVDVDASTSAVSAALMKRAQGTKTPSADLVVAVVEPSIDSTKLSDLGIKELIGRAATTYATSPANRKHNIATGAQKISGTILQDGDEFSAVKALGAVDASTGYLPELVINNNKLEKEYGGGLCQPITTLFRAVLDAGLPVTDRSNHSRRVSYYEQPSTVQGVRINWNQAYANSGNSMVGYDATVYIPAPDLKFKNDTGHAILIQAVVTNNSQVTFELYGTNDGRAVSVSKASFTAIASTAGPQFDPDSTQPSGTMKEVEKPVPGAKTSFDYTVTYPDQHSVTQTFASYYRPIAGHYLVGTAEPVPVADPAADPAATPAQ